MESLLPMLPPMLPITLPILLLKLLPSHLAASLPMLLPALLPLLFARANAGVRGHAHVLTIVAMVSPMPCTPECKFNALQVQCVSAKNP